MSSKPVSSIGILGMGNFGSFVASQIPPSMTVKCYDTNPERHRAGLALDTFAEVCAADVIILAVPLVAYPTMLSRLRPLLRSETLVVDACSVKEKPQALFTELLPGHTNVLLTHPLFGPQSAAYGLFGQHLIVTKQSGERAMQVVDFCRTTLGLTVSVISSKEHDEIMAQVHALTFFVARTLSEMGLQDTPFITPSYKMITDLVAFDQSHSNELFATIELGNAHAAVVRDAFLQSVKSVHRGLSRKDLSR